jgi:hypothetical protein
MNRNGVQLDKWVRQSGLDSAVNRRTKPNRAHVDKLYCVRDAK